MTVRRIALVCMLIGVASFTFAVDEMTIREIVVDGGVTLTVDTVSYYLGLEPEDPLDGSSSSTATGGSGIRVFSRIFASKPRITAMARSRCLSPLSSGRSSQR